MNKHPRLLCLLVILPALSPLAIAQSDLTRAEKRITTCYAVGLSGKGCNLKLLLRDGNRVVSAYRAGDTSLLSSAIMADTLRVGVNGLDSESYAHAMLEDLDAFFAALSPTQNTKDPWQSFYAVGTVCDLGGITLRRFKTLQEKLGSVPKDSPNYDLAQKCRKDLETSNATQIFTYFPPKTFQSGAGDFVVQWYSSVLYELNEKPLWPPDPAQTTYRFLWMRSFHDQVTITMTVQPDGQGQLRLNVYQRLKQQLQSSTQPLTKEQVSEVLALIQKATFWTMTTRSEDLGGNDGAEWVLEGVQGGQYHLVTRWSAGGTAFGQALMELLRLSNYNPPANEIY